MAAGKDIHQVKLKQILHLSRKQDFRWVALENVGETPVLYCAVCHKLESKVFVI